MRKLIWAACLAAVLPTVPAAAQSREERQEYREDRREARRDAREERRESREAWREYRNYDYNRPDSRYGGRYDASRYYRNDRSYRERPLTSNDRLYRGSNGQYYCRRPDGTTGLIVGALGGGVLGNLIAPNGSDTIGTLLGAGGGALLGRAVERGQARCK